MSFTYGEKLKITVFGQSHSKAIGIVIDNFPSGMKVDLENLEKFMSRRKPGGKFATKRCEEDEVEFLSGLNDKGETCGAPICAIIKNKDVRSSDYENLKVLPRPSHTDLVSLYKYGESRDVRGGGSFSGRLTAPLCIAGALCSQYLAEKGIKIGAHLYSVGSEKDIPYDSVNDEIPQNLSDFEVVSFDAKEKMQSLIERVRLDGDSVGGVIECKATGVPVGLGDPTFDGVENKISQIVFGVPAVKGIEFGSGFLGSEMLGSQNNDDYSVENGKIRTVTNNAGGINGGITNGMPIIFKVALKPTPSIFKEQQSVNLVELKEEKLTIKGRHDPCVAIRAVPVIESVTSIVILDMLR